VGDHLRDGGVTPASERAGEEEVRRFTYRSARSGSLVAGFAIALCVEALVMHLWLGARHPRAAWTLTIATIASLLWLIADYRAMAARPIMLTRSELRLRIGRRYAIVVPRDAIAKVETLTWRTLPARAPDYLDVARPSEPNILLHLAAPVEARVMGALRRKVSRVGLRVDDAPAFLDAVRERAGSARPRVTPS
jgi:hypothetical protein